MFDFARFTTICSFSNREYFNHRYPVCKETIWPYMTIASTRCWHMFLSSWHLFLALSPIYVLYMHMYVHMCVYIYIECIEIHQSNWKTSASSDFNVLSLQIVAQMLSGRGVDCMGGTKQTGKIWNKISVVYNVSLEKNVFNPIIVDRSNLADPTVTTLIWPQAMPAIKFCPISSHQAGE